MCATCGFKSTNWDIVVHGWFWHNFYFILFCWNFWKTFSPIVKIFKNLDYKNMKLNLGLVQRSTLVVNKLTTRIISEVKLEFNM